MKYQLEFDKTNGAIAVKICEFKVRDNCLKDSISKFVLSTLDEICKTINASYIIGICTDQIEHQIFEKNGFTVCKDGMEHNKRYIIKSDRIIAKCDSNIMEDVSVSDAKAKPDFNSGVGACL